MYYRYLLDRILRSSRHFHPLVMTCSQSSCLLYHSKTHALGASFYTKILSPSCDKTFDIPTFPKIPASEVKTKWFLVSVSYKFPAPLMLPYPRSIPLSHYFSSVVHKWCHRLSPLVNRRLLPEPLCQRRRSAVPWVKG